jgi:hypothetical protein
MSRPPQTCMRTALPVVWLRKANATFPAHLAVADLFRVGRVYRHLAKRRPRFDSKSAGLPSVFPHRSRGSRYVLLCSGLVQPKRCPVASSYASNSQPQIKGSRAQTTDQMSITTLSHRSFTIPAQNSRSAPMIKSLIRRHRRGRISTIHHPEASGLAGS